MKKLTIDNLKLKISSLKKISIVNFQFSILLAASLLSSCVHRDFEYSQADIETVYLNVVFDWMNEPSANPGTMSLYLFPTDGRQTIRYEFVGRDGGTIRVTAGTYHAICVNSDQRDVFFRNNDAHHTFEITTSEVAALALSPSLNVSPLDVPHAPGSENQAVMNQPPLLWSSSMTDIVISPNPASKGRSRTDNPELRMYPERIVDTYIVSVKKINNAEYLQTLSATITDMADGYLPSAMAPNDNSAILSLNMTHNAESATARGQFLTFGHCPANQREHTLMLYAILTNGSRYYFKFDVSEQAHKPAADDNIHYITVECLDIPEPGSGGDTGGGGLQPTVNDWQTENINLTM